MATIFYDGQLREIEQYPLLLKQQNGDILVIIAPDKVLHVVAFEMDPRIVYYGAIGLFTESDNLQSVSKEDAISTIMLNFNVVMGLWTEVMVAAGAKPRKPENVIMNPTADTLREHFKQSLPVVCSGALGFGKDIKVDLEFIEKDFNNSLNELGQGKDLDNVD